MMAAPDDKQQQEELEKNPGLAERPLNMLTQLIIRSNWNLLRDKIDWYSICVHIALKQSFTDIQLQNLKVIFSFFWFYVILSNGDALVDVIFIFRPRFDLKLLGGLPPNKWCGLDGKGPRSVESSLNNHECRHVESRSWVSSNPCEH